MKARFTMKEINKVLKDRCTSDKDLTMEEIQELFDTFGIVAEEQFISRCIGRMTIYELRDWCHSRHVTHKRTCEQCIFFNRIDESCPLVAVYYKADSSVMIDDSLEFSIKE